MQDGGGVRDAAGTGVDAPKRPVDRDVAQGFLGGLIGEREPLLQEVDPHRRTGYGGRPVVPAGAYGQSGRRGHPSGRLRESPRLRLADACAWWIARNPSRGSTGSCHRDSRSGPTAAPFCSQSLRVIRIARVPCVPLQNYSGTIYDTDIKCLQAEILLTVSVATIHQKNNIVYDH